MIRGTPVACLYYNHNNKPRIKNNMMKNSIYTIVNLALIGAVFFVGCDVSQSQLDAPSDVQVRMQVNSTPASTAKFTANQESSSLMVEEVKLFIDEMELESVQDDSADFEIEDFIANLPLDGSPLVITEAEIPSGIYDEFELEIENSDDDDVGVNDSDFSDETGNYSVVVKGQYNGEAFTFRSSEDFEIEMDLNPVLEITDSGSSLLVVSVDVDSWFKDSDGVDLDPNDPSNTEQINENIERSFEGFEEESDDDDDDDDDDNDDE